MLKKFRIFVLSFILVNVALGAWLAKTRSTDWNDPLNVVIYAINGDGSAVSEAYIDALTAKDEEEIEHYFSDIEDFFSREAKRYGLALDMPVDVHFAGQREVTPPLPPSRGSTLSIIVWSLKLRFWAWRHDDYPYSQDVEIFVQYFDPEESPRLAHSLGLEKGLIGVVNAFAREKSRRGNQVVMTHELLHTLGARDKYDPSNNLPLYPEGFAEPGRQPLYPQEKAEIMAGRIAVSGTTATQARRLKEVVIGEATAQEIKWLSSQQ